MRVDDPILSIVATRRSAFKRSGASVPSKRQAPLKSPTPEQRYRQLLGLPLGGRLSGTEIHRAYKRLAKRAHPDGGGNVKAFLELSAARDALMQEQRARPRN